MIPSLYIPPAPGVHYVGPAPATTWQTSYWPSSVFAAPAANYYNVNIPAAPAYPFMPAPQTFYSNFAYANPWVMPLRASSPQNYNPHVLPWPPAANNTTGQVSAQQGFLPSSPRDLLQQVADKNIQTGLAAFVRGAVITMIPALTLGVVTVARKPYTFLNLKTVMQAIGRVILLTLVAMGVGGGISAGWAMRDDIKQLFTGKNKPNPHAIDDITLPPPGFVPAYFPVQKSP